jgi:hypothetical protein
MAEFEEIDIDGLVEKLKQVGKKIPKKVAKDAQKLLAGLNKIEIKKEVPDIVKAFFDTEFTNTVFEITDWSEENGVYDVTLTATIYTLGKKKEKASIIVMT